MSDRNVGNPGVCKHGGLRRQCETCDLAEQLDAALLKLDAITKQRDACAAILRRFVSFAVEMPADLGMCLAMGNKIVADSAALLKEMSK